MSADDQQDASWSDLKQGDAAPPYHDGPICMWAEPQKGFVCTRVAGHHGQHVATSAPTTGSRFVAAVWGAGDVAAPPWDDLASVAREQMAQLPVKRAEDVAWTEDPAAGPHGLTVHALVYALEEAMSDDGGMEWERDKAESRAVVAVTPHGTYEFGVYAADWDPAARRIVVRLRELPRE